MLFGTPIPATVTRLDTTINRQKQILPSQTVPTFTVRKFMGVIVYAIDPRLSTNPPFGIDIAQQGIIVADRPSNLQGDLPITRDDTIRINNRPYVVIGVQTAGDHFEIHVRVAPASA